MRGMERGSGEPGEGANGESQINTNSIKGGAIIEEEKSSKNHDSRFTTTEILPNKP